MSNKKYESRHHQALKRRKSQRIWLLLGLGGAFLIGAALFVLRGNQNPQTLAAIEVQGAPSLKADQEKIDLGNAQLGQTVKVSFRLTNVGDKPLQFSEKPYVEVVEGC